MSAKYIWYPGEYEIYHSLLLHSRRADNGLIYPPVWKMPYLYSVCNFLKDFETPEDSFFKVVTDCDANITLDEVRYPANADIPLKKGRHSISVALYNIKGGFCTFFIDSEYLKTDESWRVSDGNANFVPAACEPAFTKESDHPSVFPFSYKTLKPKSFTRPSKKEMLLDFGKETFGPVTLKNCNEKATVSVYLGESLEEAMAGDDCATFHHLKGEKTYKLPTHAFRYIRVVSDKSLEKVTLKAEYEYLPLRDIGSFKCDDPQVKKVWELCAYTYHLCSREFLLDGIKRDRWVWSGDVYQSLQINNYLFFSSSLIRRTLIALLGKPPYTQHINTINEYTLYLIMSFWDYYFTTGDKELITTYWPRIKDLWAFMAGRLDEENGFMVGRPGDWIFVDWCDMDREGPNATEQIVLWKACDSMAKLAALAEEESDEYAVRAENLKKKIFEFFWDDEKSAFIDSYTTGNRRVSRHPQIFAILFGMVDEKTAKHLSDSVLHDDSVTPITTPYFKFYELEALCQTGYLNEAQEMIDSYWGGMLRLGATSVWEQYIPTESGAEHYAMYGRPFGRSLCHAWGTGPICFLGKYCLGVTPTDIGYRTFTVAPTAGCYKEFEGVVPLPCGTVSVCYRGGVLTVKTDCEGGTVKVGEREYPLLPGKEFSLTCTL